MDMGMDAHETGWPHLLIISHLHDHAVRIITRLSVPHTAPHKQRSTMIPHILFLLAHAGHPSRWPRCRVQAAAGAVSRAPAAR
eukprot:4101114-Prymnesium_polylepis.2